MTDSTATMIPVGVRLRAGAAAAVAVAVAAVAACGPPPADPEPRPERAPEAEALSAPLDLRARLAGTWRLANVERYDQAGAPLPDFVHRGIGQGAALGYLMHDGEHVGLVVQREAAAAPAAPAAAAPEDGASDAALAAVARYTAHFGRYVLDAENGYLVHRIAGSLDPGLTGGEIRYRYELDGDRLDLLPPLLCPDSFVTDRGCGYGTTGLQLRNVWERVAAAPDAGERARAFFGFWEIDRIEQRTAEGVEAPAEQYAGGYLMYMPSGRMAVHLMRGGRRPYSASPPPPAEAEAALRSYFSYFGPFRVLADEGVVVHDRVGHLDAGSAGSEARRAFSFLGDRLLLEPPPVNADGETLRTTVFWNRLGAS